MKVEVGRGKGKRSVEQKMRTMVEENEKERQERTLYNKEKRNIEIVNERTLFMEPGKRREENVSKREEKTKVRNEKKIYESNL